MKQHIANVITSCRILGSVLLWFFPVFSTEFYITYIICGITDMIDGTVARKTNSTGEFGARLDTAADFIFMAVSLMKFLPCIPIPGWLWIWIVVIAVIKIGNIIWGCASQKQLIAPHTTLNKITGLFLFLLPLAWSFTGLKYSSIAVCAVCSIATCAAIQEGLSIAANCENTSSHSSLHPTHHGQKKPPE